METIDIQNRSFVVRWLKGSRGDVINYQVKPLKKSIELGIYKRPKQSVDGHFGSQVHIAPDTKTLLNYTTRSLLQRNNSMSAVDDTHTSVNDGHHHGHQNGHGSSVSTPSSTESKKLHGSVSLSDIQQQSQELPLRERLISSGFTMVKSMGSISGNKMIQGELEVKDEEYYYAFILDNTSAKNAKKKVLFKAAITNNDDTHSLVSNRYSFSSDSTPKSAVKPKHDDPLSVSNGRYLQGFLLKKRRKKLQGFKKRFFSLDYKYGTLSYYLNDHNQTCRGEIVINLATVSANKKDKLIIIDSGMEIWALKGKDTLSWEVWVDALQRCFEISFEKKKTHNLNGIKYKENDNSKIPHKRTAKNEGQNLEWSQERALPYVAPHDEVYNKLEVNIKLIQQRVEQCRRESANYILKDDLRKNQFASVASASSSLDHENFKDSETIDKNGSTDSLHNFASPTSPADKGHLLYQKLFELEVYLDHFVEQTKTILDDHQYISKHNQEREKTNTTALSVFSDDEYFDAEDVISHGVILLNNDETHEDVTNKLDPRASESVSELEDDDGTEEEIEMPSIEHEETPIQGSPIENNLYPLPWEGIVERRNDILPAFTSPPSLLSFLRKNVGKDLSSVAMPVTSNEPISILQMIAETFEYADLLNKGTNTVSTSQLLSYVSAFALSYLSVHRDKTRALRKPFNPLLGETYELVREDVGFRLIAEKVSHKPPVFAFHAEHEDWECSYTVSPVQKFWGKSVELNNEGTINLRYKNRKDSFEWVQPTTMLKNLIAGERYVEPINEFEILSSKSGSSTISFRAAGMFGGRSEDVAVEVRPHNEPKRILSGKWTESLKDSQDQSIIWKAGSLVKDSKKKYGFTEFTANLNEITAVEKGRLPPTDSRLRPDIKVYENGDIDAAESLKLDLEQKQRDRRTKGMDVKPKYFEKVSSRKWKIIRGPKGYWERRKRQDWSDIEPLW
ncbi:hypothetical protein HG535_0C03340 [Zygotorulaspora mrakii]|uniref:PH domain-containing protein n=1 Tax=Zygotorulaspora mrakii TaxID=42260 RepID=A0A7H9B033_ZYGMR|nr:uncharacterized protein HG535_0C03340 [Zygotorulaspora mrakii]QLG71981.1 hypothetical protein HG535_0C03340 [Zygotorulaspora mrakii]